MQRVSAVFPLLFLLGFVSSSIAHGQSYIDTDPIGDGWGWDGSSSCRAGNSSSPTTTTKTCIDTDPVGDGWGWNGSSSCRVDNSSGATTNTGTYCIDTDPVGDGWGWDGSSSCRVNSLEQPTVQARQQTGIAAELVGEWNCYSGIVAQERWTINDSNASPAFVGGCVQSSSIRSYPLTNSQCDIKWQALYLASSHGLGQLESHLSRLVLNDNLSGTLQSGYIRDSSGLSSGYVDPEPITWRLDGFQFYINGSPKHRIAFETWDGNEYFSYYGDDEHRTTCKKF